MLKKTKCFSVLIIIAFFIVTCSQNLIIANDDIVFEEEYPIQECETSDEVYCGEIEDNSELPDTESVEEIIYEEEQGSEAYTEAELDNENDQETNENSYENSETFNENNTEVIIEDVCFSDVGSEEPIQEEIEEDGSDANDSKGLFRSIRAWESDETISAIVYGGGDHIPLTYSLISLETGETVAEGKMSQGTDFQYATIVRNDYARDDLIFKESGSKANSFELVLYDELDQYDVRFSSESPIELTSFTETENDVTMFWQGGINSHQYSILIKNPENDRVIRCFDTETSSAVIDVDDFYNNDIYVTSYEYKEADECIVFSDAMLCNSYELIEENSADFSSDEYTLAGQQYIGLDVDYHTKEEIIAFVKEHPVIVEMPFYLNLPNAEYPYSAGKLTDSVQESSVTYLNIIRYIAGIPYDVEIDSELCEIAQYGALLNAAKHEMNHTPTQPEDMPDDIYKLGYKGTSSSNLAGGDLLKNSIDMWIGDTDPYVIGSLGHRRWLLNPPMKYTGFGSVDGYTTVYVFDFSRKETQNSMVAWPSQNMPVEFFGIADAWNISTNSTIEEDKIRVSLVRKNDNRTWLFSKEKTDGPFNVRNDGYGMPGCISFLPEIDEYKPGDIFEVTITGVKDLPIQYNVEFFSICNGKHELVESIWPERTCETTGTRNLSCKYCSYCDSTVIDSLGHDYRSDKIENGKITLVCNRCGDKQTRLLPKSLTIMFMSGSGKPYKNCLPNYIYVDDVIRYYPEDIASIYSNKRWALLDVKTDDPENCLIDLTEQQIRFQKAGDYKVTFFGTYNPDVKLILNFHVVEHLKSASITTNLKSPQKYGTTIRLQAKAIGGSGSYTYSFHAINSKGVRYDLTHESFQNYYDWSPDPAGNWKFSVDITDDKERKTVTKSSKTIDFVIEKLDISKAKVTGLKDLSYNGSAQTQSFEVSYGDTYLYEGTDYEASYKNNVKIGTATVIIKGIGNCDGTMEKTFKITKKAQKITVKTTKVSMCVGEKSTISVSGNKGELSYGSSNPRVAKVSSKGVITAVKFGTTDIKVKASATSKYASVEKVVKVTVVPGATSSVSTSLVSNGIRITWKIVQGATGYDLYQNGYRIVYNKKDLSYVDKSNYANGSKLTYKVVARSSFGVSAKSNSALWYFLEAPEIRELTSRKSGRLSIWWTKNNESSGSQIQYSTDKSFKSGVKDVSVQGTDNRSHVINSLPSGKTYYVRIRRYKTVGGSKYYSQWSLVKNIVIS